jgi:hypothetical protein
MVTNRGFRDIIHIARHQRVEHYSIMQELPWQSRPLSIASIARWSGDAWCRRRERRSSP